MSARHTVATTPADRWGAARTLAVWADGPTPSFVLLRWLHGAARICFIVLREMEDNRLSLRTGALTYALLLSLVPLLAMSTAVVKGLGGGDQLREVVYTYLDTLEQTAPSPLSLVVPTEPSETDQQSSPAAPDQATDLTDHLRSAADKVFDYVDRTSFATLGTFGILGVFLSVILVLGQIEAAMNAIWHVQDSRSLLRKVADYLTLMVLLPVAINIALAAGTLLSSQSLGRYLDRIIPLTWLQSLLLAGVPILFLTMAIYVAYIFFPNTKVKTIPTLIGALLAGTLWFVTQNLFISLQIGVAKYNAIYGSFATIPLFLVWIYFGWLFVLLGAEVAYAIQHRSTYRLIERPTEPSHRLSAAFDICAAVQERFVSGQGSRIDDLAAALPAYENDLLEQTTELLIDAGMLHHSRETGELMPSGPPDRLDHRLIITTIIGSHPPDTHGGRQAERIIAAATTELPRQNPAPTDGQQATATAQPRDASEQDRETDTIDARRSSSSGTTD